MGTVWSGLSLVAVLLSDPNMAGLGQSLSAERVRRIKRSPMHNAHSCWEILERKLTSIHCL